MANNTLTYGFQQYSHLAARRLTDVGESMVYSMIQESAAIHTKLVNDLYASLVKPVTDHKIRYMLPGSGTLQPLDENGDPNPVRPSGYFDVALPIQGGGDAWATNRVSRALMTVEEASELTYNSMLRDSDWMRRHILAAILHDGAGSAQWTYSDADFGNLSIEGLANGDSVTYTFKNGKASAADDHYLAQSAAISDAANPFPTIYEELMEHASNSGPVVVYAPTALKATIKALTNFVEVDKAFIVPGVSSDRVDGTADQYIAWGDTVMGACDDCLIVEARCLPDAHMIAHAVGAGPVLGMREYPDASLQGFFAENDAGNGNITKTKMIRYAGFGTLNRIAAVAYYVGSGSYSTPSGYTTPLAI